MRKRLKGVMMAGAAAAALLWVAADTDRRYRRRLAGSFRRPERGRASPCREWRTAGPI